MALELTPMDVAGLKVVSAPCDLRRDVHIYMRYVQERQIKRSVRGNNLPKADALRLAKLMANAEAIGQVQQVGLSVWVGYIDALARSLGFVSYDIKGTYAGYSSVEPSFPDNYVVYQRELYERFLALPLAEQERFLQERLLAGRNGCASEFFNSRILGCLSPFDSQGCAVGVAPTLDFPQARRFLLGTLQSCRSGVWYSTASLVRFLKEEHPYFLIPRNPQSKDAHSEDGRYGNFSESRDRWVHREPIREADPDAFERVEGRYVERFLEDAPLLLGYVDVAYADPSAQVLPQPFGTLKAFRVSDRLLHALAGDIPEPRVTVQPNLEVYVESAFYPAGILAQLLPLGEVTTEDITTILRLKKERVAAQVAQNGQLDVIALLTRLSSRDLPANVARELAEWAEHSAKFTLYEGVALFEGDVDPAITDPFTVERISPALRIVHSPGKLYAQLEKAEQAPLAVKHAAFALSLLPEKARTVFARKSAVAQPPQSRQPMLLRRRTTITLDVPSKAALEALRQALLEVRCPVEVDRAKLSISFSSRHEAQVAEAIRALGKEYSVQIKDMS